ncbi:uncharacterized protein [Rhodnius prolixus]|uniref:uncharacterized protein n=1 Tax=Rhodnius prolixus TaxID=13249 RepID=UPI003D189DC9
MPFRLFRWALPSEEETAELYRRIDQLIVDIYTLLRTIILGPPPVQIQQHERETEENQNTMPDLIPLQDNVDVPEEEEDRQPPVR